MHCMIKHGGQVFNGVQLVGINFSKRFCRSWVQQGVVKVTGSLHGGITGGRFWHRALVRENWTVLAVRSARFFGM